MPAEWAEPAPFVLDRQSQRLEPLWGVTTVLRTNIGIVRRELGYVPGSIAKKALFRKPNLDRDAGRPI